MVMLMVCVAGHQCPSVSQVKGHSAKHSHRKRHEDRGNDTLASSLSLMLPVSLWGSTELCRITVSLSFSPTVLSRWPDWFTAYYGHHGALSTHVWLVYLCWVHYTHKHKYLHKHTHTHNQKDTEVRREVVKFSALAISHPCCEQLWCQSAGNLREKKFLFL